MNLLERRMNVRQVANTLAVSTEKVRELIELGALEAIDVRTPGASRAHWAVSRRSVEAFILRTNPALMKNMPTSPTS